MENNKDIYARMLQGETIAPADLAAGNLGEVCYQTKKLLLEMNSVAKYDDAINILSKITGREIDKSVMVFTPIHINYGKNLKIGKNVFINFDCVFLDLGGITIEDNVQIAPKVSIISEGHPIAPTQRKSLSAAHVHIKENAWIGTNATILPGVTIGKNSIVAAGAVVTKDVPDNTIVGGIPAKVLKSIP